MASNGAIIWKTGENSAMALNMIPITKSREYLIDSHQFAEKIPDVEWSEWITMPENGRLRLSDYIISQIELEHFTTKPIIEFEDNSIEFDVISKTNAIIDVAIFNRMAAYNDIFIRTDAPRIRIKTVTINTAIKNPDLNIFHYSANISTVFTVIVIYDNVCVKYMLPAGLAAVIPKDKIYENLEESDTWYLEKKEGPLK